VALGELTHLSGPIFLNDKVRIKTCSQFTDLWREFREMRAKNSQNSTGPGLLTGHTAVITPPPWDMDTANS
jgi:hypothetical protein